MKNDPTLYIGDIHGHWDLIGTVGRMTKGTKATLIQVGDFGIGFPDHQMGVKEAKKLDHLTKRLIDYGTEKLLVLKGNHDDPSRFPSKFRDMIEFLPPIDIRMINGQKHLFIGGAISVDRKMRVPGSSWWAEEKIDYEEVDAIELPDDIDVVVTHTAPFQAPAPSSKGLEVFYHQDPSLQGELVMERECLTKLCDRLGKLQRPIQWIYGHFHEALSSKHGLISFRQLDIDEAWMIPQTPFT